MKGFVIGATGSGTGKTTLTLAILAWLRARGMKVAPFKVGPDFIDPGHHACIAGRTSYNLDSWMLSKDYNRRLFHEQSRGADLAVVEGVMGLFDGYDAITESGSTAQMAKWLDLPVLLVVSAKGKARSAAAVVKGFESFDPDLTLAGVVFTCTGSQRHYAYLKDAVEQNCTTPCLGHLPRNDSIVMPERHLGLTTADEHVILPAVIDTLVSMVDQGLDMDRLISNLLKPAKISEPIDNEKTPKPPVGKDAAGPETSVESQTPAGPIKKFFPKTPRIAVARDKAFCFYYPDNLAMLENAGACLVFFSPLAEDRLPDDIDGLYLGGGYPELFADTLSQKPVLLSAVKACSRQGMPIYGECGGFMFLCKALWPKDHDQPVSMAGCFDLQVRMSGKLKSLGYREITFAEDTVIGVRGARVRGHEFHYSSVVPQKSPLYGNVFAVTSRAGQDVQVQGYQIGQTLGSYLHVHFGSNPDVPRCFVENCKKFRKQRLGG
ncbi:MAG: cobyrinate a,c-diamide synthase [Desulfotignum sp.]|nr:cobyrinate a,c-diamide synthase [Desulfotignum sp.]